MHKFCVALIGGIGAGKTTVAKIFSTLGIDIISADIISRHLTKTKKVKAQLKHLFGTDIFNNLDELDRKALASIIFSNPQKKQQLETLLHPLIRRDILIAIKQTTSHYCMIEIPVFKNKDDYPYINKILSVSIDKDKQISQTIQRDNKTVHEIENIINQQMNTKIREKLADDIIYNNSNLDNLQKQCRTLHAHYVSLALAPHQ